VGFIKAGVTFQDPEPFDDSQLEKEINEKLADCHSKLLSADVDRKESERESKLKETFSNLQRIFPGTMGASFIIWG
jgi:hypothetical protein